MNVSFASTISPFGIARTLRYLHAPLLRGIVLDTDELVGWTQRERVGWGDVAEVFVLRRHVIRAEVMRWGGAPEEENFNIPNEATNYGRRCLVPSTGFILKASSSGDHVLALPAGADRCCLGGIWREAKGDGVARFNIVTCPAGPDIQPFAERQPVVVPEHQWAAWLNSAFDTRDLQRGWPQGTISTEPAANAA